MKTEEGSVIDYEKILEAKLFISKHIENSLKNDNHKLTKLPFVLYDEVAEVMCEFVKAKVKESLPVILKEVSEQATASFHTTMKQGQECADIVINKQSILSLESSLIEKLNL